jgi:hypothetical protein
VFSLTGLFGAYLGVLLVVGPTAFAGDVGADKGYEKHTSQVISLVRR